MSLELKMAALGRDAQSAGTQLRLADETSRNAALRAMAKHVRAAQHEILAANETDMHLSLIHI